MRLILFLLLSTSLHAIFFGLAPQKTDTPVLAIAHDNNKSIDLQIRTQVKQKVLAPPPVEKPPEKTIERKPAKKKTTPIKKPPTPKQQVQKLAKKKIVKKESVDVSSNLAPQPIQREENTNEHQSPEVQEFEIQEPQVQQYQEQSYSSVPKTPRLIQRAEYLSNPAPEYPEQSRRRRHEGTVTLLVDIGSDGFVQNIEIQETSGCSLLDRAAKKAVTKWRFTPAIAGGQKVESQVLVPVLYKLTG